MRKNAENNSGTMVSAFEPRTSIEAERMKMGLTCDCTDDFDGTEFSAGINNTLILFPNISLDYPVSDVT